MNDQFQPRHNAFDPRSPAGGGVPTISAHGTAARIDGVRAEGVRAALRQTAPAADAIELEKAVAALMWMADHGVNRTPKATLRAEVVRLQKALDEVEAAVTGLSMDAILSLDSETSGKLGNVALRLVALSGHVGRLSGSEAQSIFAERAKSRQRKPQARRVAEEAAEIFQSLTGRRPTISTSVGYGHKAAGPFIDLLAGVFGALNIKASPESQARAVV